MGRTPAIVLERLVADLRALARIGAGSSGGITRRAFSEKHREASQWLAHRMTAAGLASRIDAVGNVIGRLGSPRGAAIVCGSHIDTVPDGGWLDGAYGVLAGLECARALQDAGSELPSALEVVAFADEEGTYLSLLGSRGMLGALTEAELMAARDPRGKPLHEAMQEADLDVLRFAEATRAARDIDAYVELHIEQGPVLEQRGIDVGVVEGIVGILLVEHIFTGSADHAGTTPIDLRRDALRCAAEFITEAYRRLPDATEGRFAFGAIEVLPGASNVIPYSARVIQEIRAIDEATIETLLSDSSGIARHIGNQLRVEHDVRRLSFNSPARMSHRVMNAVEGSCVDAGVSYLHMPSGAGHDAQSFARLCAAGMIFVPSRRGASHRPDEHTDERDLATGADILLRTIQKLAA